MLNVSSRHIVAARKLALRLDDVDMADVLLILQYGAAAFYDQFPQPKAGGGVRIISAPYNPLKEVQRALLDYYFNDLPVSDIAHAYVRGRGIESNAYPHRCSRSMVGFDLKSAYDQVSFQGLFLRKVPFMVAGRDEVFFSYSRRQNWEILPLELSILEVVEQLVDLQGRLPQGAPTSPALFNFACRALDRELAAFARRVGGVVTRFADNIVFSWEKEEIDPPVFNALRRIIAKQGFSLNYEKTHSIRRGNRQGVPLRLPGVHIMDGELRVPRKIREAHRMMLYCAGAAGNQRVHNGIKGYSVQVEADLPQRLKGVYGKARLRHSSE